VLDFSVKLDAAKVKALLNRAPAELQAAIERGSHKLGSEMQKTAQAVLERHTPFPAVAFGNLVRGIQYEVKTQPPLGLTLYVAPPADVYALPVETGSRPHFPPIAALLPWVKKKLSLPAGGIDEPEAKALAFVVARKISKTGTKGVFFFERTRQAHEPDAAATYDFYLDEAIARLEASAQ